MGRRAADRRPGLSAAAALGAALAVLTAACGDAPAPSDPSATDAALFAVGTEATWALLSAPRSGGAARLAPFAGPADSAAWRGSSDLPPTARAHRLGERHLALLTSDGRVLRYDPVRDLTSSVGRLAPGAEWTTHERWGVFRDTASGSILQLAAGGAWTYAPDPGATWAAPARDGSVVAIVPGRGEEPGAVIRYQRGGGEPTGRLSGRFVPLAVITGFGGQVAAVRETGGRWELVLAALPDLELVARTGLPGRPDALAGSPSGHELYAAVGDRVLVFGRPSLDRRAERSIPGPALALRPGLLGGPLLVRTEDGVHLLPWDGDGSVPLESRWRPDLPLSLPDGSVLAVQDDRVMAVRPGGGEPVLQGPADRWWIPVRWDPTSAERVAASSGSEGETAGAPSLPDSTGGPGTTGTTGGGGEPPGAEETEEADRAAPSEPEPGFYAVVAAARSVDGIRRLLDDLSGEGWPTALQEWKDDAGNVWYRGLVGPYGTRPEAERTARRLQRERDVSVWVKELGPGISGQP